MSRTSWTIAGLVLAVVAALIAAMSIGSTIIPIGNCFQYLFTGDAGAAEYTTLLHEFRMPRIVTAILAGLAMALAGLLMQAIFANPLAEPYILGVSAGASFGVAVVTLGAGGAFLTVADDHQTSVTVAAALGAAAVMGVVVILSQWITSSSWLLITGVMLGSVVSSIVSFMLAYASPGDIREFVMWGLGSFSGVLWEDLQILAPVVAAGAVVTIAMIPALNALLLGESYARTMGIRMNLTRVGAVVATALLAGSVTAYCGPIAFIGIAAPHVARIALGKSDHRVVLPVAALVGIVIALICAALTTMPGRDGILPINVLTAFFGAPIVVLVLVRSLRSGATR